MKRVMLVGEIGSGKSTLIGRLSASPYQSRRTMSVEFHENFINTPGEFLENRRFYHALITSAIDCDCVFFLQDATKMNCLYPPNFASALNKPTFGVISKVDSPDVRIETARIFLQQAGVEKVFLVSANDTTGIEELRTLLAS